MTTASDLSPTAAQISLLVERVDDEQLANATPCTEFAVRDLLVHLLGLTLAFRHAATRTPLGIPGEPGHGGTDLDGWRTRLPEQLDSLAAAWRDPSAWEGMTEVGGITLPASAAGGFAHNELILHGWDLARATRQPYAPDALTVEACLRFTEEIAGQGFDAYGPPVPTSDDATSMERLLGLAGRDPFWTTPIAPDLRDDPARR